MIGCSFDDGVSSISQNFLRFIFIFSNSVWSCTKNVLENRVCNFGCLFDPGVPIQVHPRGVNRAMGSPGLPLTSSTAWWRSAQSSPMSTSARGRMVVHGKSMFFRWGQFLLYIFQFTASMSPVTWFAVNAVTLVLTLPHKLSSRTSIGLVLNVFICPFNTFTVTYSVLPCRPSSAATSELI